MRPVSYTQLDVYKRQVIIRKFENSDLVRMRITETEAYRGIEDKACHASKGRTPRTELLYRESGIIYVYLCYGIHWLMNVITGEKEQPQGVLIRACEGFEGPARLTKRLAVDKSFNGEMCIRDRDMRIWQLVMVQERTKRQKLQRQLFPVRCLKHLFPAQDVFLLILLCPKILRCV